MSMRWWERAVLNLGQGEMGKESETEEEGEEEDENLEAEKRRALEG